MLVSHKDGRCVLAPVGQDRIVVGARFGVM